MNIAIVFVYSTGNIIKKNIECPLLSIESFISVIKLQRHIKHYP